jgi:hypothetical protein
MYRSARASQFILQRRSTGIRIRRPIFSYPCTSVLLRQNPRPPIRVPPIRENPRPPIRENPRPPDPRESASPRSATIRVPPIRENPRPPDPRRSATIRVPPIRENPRSPRSARIRVPPDPRKSASQKKTRPVARACLLIEKQPWSIIASATFRKPAMLAPFDVVAGHAVLSASPRRLWMLFMIVCSRWSTSSRVQLRRMLFWLISRPEVARRRRWPPCPGRRGSSRRGNASTPSGVVGMFAPSATT